MNDTFTANCPTCGTICNVQWHGLDLVENTGDETLASKSYTPVQPEPEPIPEWILNYDAAGYQSSAGRAIKYLLERLKKYEQ
jgi:hypothetical protein